MTPGTWHGSRLSRCRASSPSSPWCLRVRVTIAVRLLLHTWLMLRLQQLLHVLILAGLEPIKPMVFAGEAHFAVELYLIVVFNSLHMWSWGF